MVAAKFGLAGLCALILSGAGVAAYGQIPVRPAVPEGLGVNTHFTDARPGEMEMLASTGIRWIRTDFIWSTIERQRGQYDFSAYDRLMASLQAHKIKAMLILDGVNPLYDEGKFPYTDEARAAFARFAAAGVRHFKGNGVLWEMWNEPNVKRSDNPTPGVYAKLALAAGEAIRKAAPKETYVGPATSLVDMPFLEACFKAGLLRYWSGVTVHPYRFQDPETVVPDYEQLRALIAKYAPRGKTVPVLQGEWGWASVYNKKILLGWAEAREGMDDEMQGRLLARQWLTNIACGIPLSIWYDWHDDGPDPNDPEAHCGMVLYPYQKGPEPGLCSQARLLGVANAHASVQRLPLRKVAPGWPGRGLRSGLPAGAEGPVRRLDRRGFKPHRQYPGERWTVFAHRIQRRERRHAFRRSRGGLALSVELAPISRVRELIQERERHAR